MSSFHKYHRQTHFYLFICALKQHSNMFLSPIHHTTAPMSTALQSCLLFFFLCLNFSHEFLSTPIFFLVQSILFSRLVHRFRSGFFVLFLYETIFPFDFNIFHIFIVADKIPCTNPKITDCISSQN